MSIDEARVPPFGSATYSPRPTLLRSRPFWLSSLTGCHGLPIHRLSDAVAPGVVLGQALGRLGCLITGDALGPQTDGFWGIRYLNPGAMAPQLGVAYQPTFAYEAAWDLVVFAILWTLRKRVRGDGHLFAIYLGLYAVGKFALTFLRSEVIWLGGLQEAQLLAVGLLLLSIRVVVDQRIRTCLVQDTNTPRLSLPPCAAVGSEDRLSALSVTRSLQWPGRRTRAQPIRAEATWNPSRSRSSPEPSSQLT